MVGWWLGVAAWAANGLVPIQGAVSDPGGAPYEGTRELIVRVYAGPSGSPVWDDTLSVFFDGGRFTALLGSEADLDLDLFAQNGDLSVTIQPVGDAESERVVLAWAPRAAWSARAGDADKLGGVAATDYQLKSAALVPASGLSLSGTALSVDPTAFVARTAAGDSTIHRDLAVTRNATVAGTFGANGGLSATTGAFSGALAANGGVTGTTGTFSGALAANGGLSGTTGAFSGALAANGGLTGTTGAFTGGVSGSTGTFSGALAANGGLTGTTATFSGALNANGWLYGSMASFTGSVGIGGAPQSLLHIQSAGESMARITGDGPGYINAGLLLEATHAANAFRGLGTFYFDKTSQTEWFTGRAYGESDSFQVLRRASAPTPSSASADPCPGQPSAPCGVPLLNVSNKGYVSMPEMPYFFGTRDADGGAAFSGYKTYRAIPVINKGTLANGSSWYNSATGVFTAPLSGLYSFSWVVLLESVDVGQFLDPRYGWAGTEYYYGPRYTFATSYVADGYYPETGSVLVYMNAGETFYVNVGGSGGTCNVYNSGTWAYIQGAFLH